ncbi:hypothetical protein ABZT23_31975 [Streptomyces sp. NPDC005386]|uniref:hypothetical protein n=1 Tax=Streptomyces sp. NPDC005386 TaxID=3154562 RepID=UPI0033B5D758
MTPTPPAAAPGTRIRWQPTWSPDKTDPGLPPITLITDPHDHPDYTTTALAAHQPAAGRIAVHPTPLATAPAYLAQDLIRALGKHLLLPDGEAPWWTRNADESWRVAVAWTQALGISHYVICRAHRITGRHLEHLMALREHTRIQLTLVVSGPTPAALATVLKTVSHHLTDTLENPRLHLQTGQQQTPSPAGDYHWWHPAPLPAPEDEPWYELPRRPRRPTVVTPRRDAPAQPSADRPHTGVIALPAFTHPDYPGTSHQAVAMRIHTRIAHPVHAAAVAARVLAGFDTDQLSKVTLPTPQGPAADLPATLPAWMLPLQEAARIFNELQGYIRPDLPAHLSGADQPFRVPSWEQDTVAHATETCRLIPAPTRKRPSNPRKKRP